MNWIYKNNSDSIVLYRNFSLAPGETLDLPYPVPDSLGLTCIQEGSGPDPVLFHDDVSVAAGALEVIMIDAPKFSHCVYLSILNLSDGASVDCSFNSSENNHIPIDSRGFVQPLNWELCSRIFLNNSGDSDALISVTAIEVWGNNAADYNY